MCLSTLQTTDDTAHKNQTREYLVVIHNADFYLNIVRTRLEIFKSSFFKVFQ
jgi:hypothetical protein